MGLPLNQLMQSLLGICTKPNNFGGQFGVFRVDNISELSDAVTRLQDISSKIIETIFSYSIPAFGDSSSLLEEEESRLNEDSLIQRVTAIVNEPKDRTDNVYRFTAGLPMAINIDINFENVSDASAIRIQVPITIMFRNILKYKCRCGFTMLK